MTRDELERKYAEFMAAHPELQLAPASSLHDLFELGFACGTSASKRWNRQRDLRGGDPKYTSNLPPSRDNP